MWTNNLGSLLLVGIFLNLKATKNCYLGVQLSQASHFTILRFFSLNINSTLPYLSDIGASFTVPLQHFKRINSSRQLSLAVT